MLDVDFSASTELFLCARLFGMISLFLTEPKHGDLFLASKASVSNTLA